jgi:DNA repair exonuclease SbcCD nuclease subunit
MKFLAFSDQHLESKLYNIPELEQDNRELFKMVVDKAMELGVDYLISVGDLFDNNRPNSETIRFVSEELSRLSADVTPLAIAGDHSKPVNGATWEHVCGFHSVNNFDSFVGVDYNDNPADVIALINHELNKRAKDTVRWIFMHQQIPELWPFCEEKKKISIKDLDLSNQCGSIEGILLGDIHIRREMRYFDNICNKELFVGYCGSLGVTAANETSKPGLYYYDGQKLSTIEYTLPRKYITIEIHDHVAPESDYLVELKKKYEVYKQEAKRPVFLVKIYKGSEVGNNLNFLYDIGYVRMTKVKEDKEGNEEMVNIRSELKTMDRIEAVLKQMTSSLENADLVFDLASKLLTEADPKMVLDNYKATIYGTV